MVERQANRWEIMSARAKYKLWQLLRMTHSISDKKYIETQYTVYLHKRLDLCHPRAFNEKLQWIKLNDRNPLYTVLVDKYEVKQYIAEKIGEKYVVPLLGVWDHANEIDFSSLPAQFVLKCTHDSGSVEICRDKNQFDINEAIFRLEDGLRHNYFYRWREWPYKNVKPRIIAEKYLNVEDGNLEDYKVMCFNGEPQLIQLHRGRYSGLHTQDFYNKDWVLQPYNQVGYSAGEPPAAKPTFLSEMLNLSRILSEGIPHVRVDWYYHNNQLYFGEMTFFDAAGYNDFYPDEVNYLIGDWIRLPKI